MGGEQAATGGASLRNFTRPEAVEFARTGRVDNRQSADERRERFLAQTVLVVLLCVGVFAACVFLLV
jgi:hypothetical protein